MRPNYLQVWGIARNRGVHVRDFDLVEAKGWAPDLAQLDLQEGTVKSYVQSVFHAL